MSGASVWPVSQCVFLVKFIRVSSTSYAWIRTVARNRLKNLKWKKKKLKKMQTEITNQAY